MVTEFSYFIYGRFWFCEITSFEFLAYVTSLNASKLRRKLRNLHKILGSVLIIAKMRSEVSSKPNAILYETCWSIYVSANDAEMFNTVSWQLIYCFSKKIWNIQLTLFSFYFHISWYHFQFYFSNLVTNCYSETCSKITFNLRVLLHTDILIPINIWQ